jgi:hypothetical protein
MRTGSRQKVAALRKGSSARELIPMGCRRGYQFASAIRALSGYGRVVPTEAPADEPSRLPANRTSRVGV